MLEVSRDAAAAREEQLVICAAELSKYFPICTVTLERLLCRLRLRH
jgi:hypothetical protein